MKYLLFIIILTCNILYVSGQTLKKKKIVNSGIIEKYTVNAQTNEFEGYYIKILKSTRDTLSQGYYEKNKRIGEWIFNYKSLHFKYNYTNNDFEPLNNAFYEADSFYIKTGNLFTLTKVNRPAIYLDSDVEMRMFLAKDIQISKDIINNGIEDYAVASIIVDTLGNFKFNRIEKSISSSFDQNIRNTIEKMNGSFIPAEVNGKVVESKIYIVFNVYFMEPKMEFELELYRAVINYVYYKGN
ncbi:MAG: hypothetical protein KAT68_07445 [Bacteroidales bacterium]|nr:hypothetical protein [Bacteroidales bacterium]